MPEKIADDLDADIDLGGGDGETPSDPQPSPQEKGKTKGVMSYLTASTGSEALESYQDTPLNPNSDEGIAQIMRGLEGLADRKVDDFAVLDIGLGAVKFLREKTEDEEVEGLEDNQEAP